MHSNHNSRRVLAALDEGHFFEAVSYMYSDIMEHGFHQASVVTDETFHGITLKITLTHDERVQQANKPCPFCGGSMAIEEDKYCLEGESIFTPICSTNACVVNSFFKTKEELLEAWNNRVE